MHAITLTCLQDLKVSRQELTSAYIKGSNIVIKENGKYILKNESDVRKENKQHLDVDKRQREEEKILTDIVTLLSPSKEEKLDKEANKNLNNEKEAISFLKKISDLVHKLVNVFTPKNKDDTTTLNPIEVMKNSIDKLKQYKEESKDRTYSLKKLRRTAKSDL